jgi:hypothetical protein
MTNEEKFPILNTIKERTLTEKLDLIIFYLQANLPYKMGVGAKIPPAFVLGLNWTNVEIQVAGKDIEHNLFNILLNKLIKDEYVTYSEHRQLNGGYEITAEGLMFEGYVKQDINDALEDARIIHNETRLRDYTLLAALAGFSLALIEVLVNWDKLSKLICGCH